MEDGGLVPKNFSDLTSGFKSWVIGEDKTAEIILISFTYLLIAIGIIMILKLYFQTVYIFAKYFPIVTLPLYIIGAWIFSALLFYMAWDLGYGDKADGSSQDYLMSYNYAAFLHQGLLVGGVFLMIAPFTLLMPRLRFGRSSSDSEGCCKTICFPTFVWVVFLFIVLLVTFAGYSLYSLLRSFYGLSVFNCMGIEGIFVFLALFYLFALFQILAQRKIIVSGENILGELRKPFKCLHSRPYLFVYIAVLVFFSLAALGVTAYFGVEAYGKFQDSTATDKTTRMIIVGAFSGMAAVFVLIAMTLGLVISCSNKGTAGSGAQDEWQLVRPSARYDPVS